MIDEDGKEHFGEFLEDEEPNVEEESSHSGDYLFHLSELNQIDDKVQLLVGGVQVKFVIDSGSCANVIDKKTWEGMKRDGVKGRCIKEIRPLYPYGSNTPLTVLGRFEASVLLDKKTYEIAFYVIDCDGTPLLGKQTARELGVLLMGYPLRELREDEVVSSENFKLQLKQQFPVVFTGIGRLKGFEIRLKINPAIRPVMQPTIRYALHLVDDIKTALESKLAAGIIERVEEPSAWVSPLVVGKMKNGELRLIVDAREANKAIERELHPIPTIEETTSKLHGAVYFSVLDCNEAFHQLQLHADSREITTFSTPFGLMR
jgi:hypothetical protein